MFNEIFRGRSKATGLFLGAPEAEGEASENSRMPLSKVYYDYHGLSNQLSGEKFILIGRKGSGKSAFAEYVVNAASGAPNLFAKFIRKNDFSLESIAQVRTPSGELVDSAAFIRWLIYVNLIKLFLESEAAKADSKFDLLNQFLKRNSGFVDIKGYQINEIVRKQGFEVSIEYFKRFMRSKYGKDVQIKEERAPFFRLLPHLEGVLISVLSSKLEAANKNSYVLFFDDLDLGYSSNNKAARDLIVDILRVVKEVNNDVFGRRGLGAKAVVLLRDDIEADLANNYADTAKIFSSYGVRISWYQDGFLQNIGSEDDLYLKAFINNRITIAFKEAGRSKVSGSPWESLVKFEPKGKTTFKDVVNNTLFRPRDLLLYFLPLQNAYFDVPIEWSACGSLTNSYSEELARELKNEMSAFYEPNQIEMIFRALARINRQSSCSFASARIAVSSEVAGSDPDEILYYLFERSLVGSRDSNGWLTFNCRSRADSLRAGRLPVDQEVVVQYGVRNYVHRKY